MLLPGVCSADMALFEGLRLSPQCQRALKQVHCSWHTKLLQLCTSCCACSELSCCCAGYLDAPSAVMAPLSPLVKSVDALPDVTIVFCSLEALKIIKVSHASLLKWRPVH